MGIGRRAFLRLGFAVGVLGAAGVGGLAVTGRLDDAQGAARRRVQGDGPDDPPPDVRIGGLIPGTFRSPAMGGKDVEFTISFPPGTTPGARLPVVLALYGRGGSHNAPFRLDNLALANHQAAIVNAGAPPFAIATVEAGPDSYWHKRASGIDPQTMIVEEYLPVLAERGLRTDRIGLHGESMGGYGVLLLAQRLGRTRVAAVAADAPAIFRRAGDSSSGAFDDAADFAAHDVLAGSPRLAGIPIRIVCGSLDPFYDAVQAFASLPHDPPIVTSYRRAGHSPSYWRSESCAQLRFLAGCLPR